MNDFSIELPTLITATLTMSFSAMIAMLALSWFKPSGHRIYRLVWFAVILNGIMLARISIDVPVLSEESSTSLASLLGQHEIPFSDLFPDIDARTDSPRVASAEANSGIQGSLTGRNSESNSAISTSTAMIPVTGKVSSINWGLVAFAIWVSGMLVSICWLIFQYVAFLRLARSATPAPKAWQHDCDDTCRQVGLSRPLPLYVHENLGPALYLSFRGYRIIVPRELWSRMGSEQRAAIVRHEVEHCRRRDVFMSLFAFVVASIHWFNPFAWIAVRQLNQAAEWACDDAAVTDLSQQSVFARALLSISTSNSKHLVGVHGVGNSNLKLRIHRLLIGQKSSSRTGKVALFFLAVLILVSGWLNLRLVTNVASAAKGEIAVAVADEELEAKIKKFASQLADSETTNPFRETAATEAGIIAIGHQVRGMADAMREEAAKDVVPEFFNEIVDDEFRKNFDLELRSAESDFVEVDRVLHSLRDQIKGDSDADKLLKRFMASENSALVLYFSELRKKMNPGRNVVMEHLGRVLADDGNGKYIVRESAKAPLQQKLKRLDNADDHLQFLKSELNLIGKEIFEKDDLHKKIKSRLMESRGAIFVLSMMMEGDQSLESRLEQYLNQVEEFFEDAPDGLVVREEARDHLVNGMQQMDDLLQKMKVLQEPILKIVRGIDESKGDAEKSIKQYLMSDIGVAYLANRLPIETSEIGGLEDRIKAQLLQVTDAGLIVREDRQEEVSQFAKQMLRGNRKLRRQLRIVENRTGKIPAEQLGTLTKTPLSQLLLVEKVTEYMHGLRFDAWPVWVEEHFELRDGKYVVRDDAQDSIQQVIEESAQIQQQLENDDF